MPAKNEAPTLQEWLDTYRCEVKTVALEPGVLGVLIPLPEYRARLIYVEHALHWRVQHETLWHEVAHLVRRDNTAGEFCATGAWGQRKIERATDRLACILALPDAMLARHGIDPGPDGWVLPARDNLIYDVADDASVTERMVLHRLGLVDMRTGVSR